MWKNGGGLRDGKRGRVKGNKGEEGKDWEKGGG